MTGMGGMRSACTGSPRCGHALGAADYRCYGRGSTTGGRTRVLAGRSGVSPTSNWRRSACSTSCESGEELWAAIPAVLSGDVGVPALVGVTERRLLLLTRSADDVVVVTDATHCARYIDRTSPIPFRDQEIRLDGNAEHLARVWSVVDEIGDAALTGGLSRRVGCG